MIFVPSKRIWTPGSKAPFAWTQRFGIDRGHRLARGLGGYWLMNEGSGSTVRDISGNGNHGTFNGDISWTAGKYGPCLDMTAGGDTQVKISNPITTGEGTIVFWFSWPYEIGAAHEDKMFFGTSGGDDIDLWYLNDGTHIRAWYNRTDDEDMTYYPSWAANTWHQIVGVIQSGDSKLYADGVLVDTNTSSSVLPVGGTWWVGGGLSGLVPEQKVDNISIYNRALSASEIQSLYQEPNQLIWRPRSPGWISYAAAGGGETYVRTINDGVGISDAMGRVQDLSRTIEDGLSVADVPERTQVLTRAFNDAAGIADAIIKAQGYARTIADDIGALDAITKSQAFARTVADGMGLADLVTRVVAYARTLAEALGLTDIATGAKGSTRTISDDMGITDSVARAMVQARTVADAMGVTDDVTRVQVQLRTIADTLGLTDLMTPGQILLISDAMGITDSMSRTQVQIRAVADTLGITDDLTRIAAYVFMQAEDIGIADAMLRVAVAIRTISDDIGVTDARSVQHNVGGLIKAAWAFMIIRQSQN